MDAVGIEQSVEVAADLGGLAVGTEPGRAQQQFDDQTRRRPTRLDHRRPGVAGVIRHRRRPDPARRAPGLGDRDTARSLLGEAVDTSARLGTDANHRFTAFGPTGVGLYRISIARVLGDFGTAVEAAQRIDPARIPLVERRARYWSDVARSFHHWGKPEQCYRALLAAEHASPDEVRYRKPIQQITAGLLRHPTAHTLPGLRAFATRTGTPA